MPKLLRLFAALAIALIAVPAAADRGPTMYDKSALGLHYNGKQNMPFTLYGAMIGWDADCRKGNAAQCLRLAQIFHEGINDIRADDRVAVGYYLRACEKGSGEGCARAAQWLREGTAGFTNPALADQQAERGCTVLKDQSSCAFKAVGLAASGGAESVQASALVDSACGAGNDDGCRIKANGLYARSDAASRAEALKLFEPACTAKRAWGCMGMTDAYRNGLGVAKDRAKANDYARVGCTQGVGDKLRLCTLHGIALAQTQDKASLNRGEGILDGACTAGDGMACDYIGRIGANGLPGATTTMGESNYYLRHGCDLQYGPACGYLAASYDGNGDAAVAVALYDKACRLGDQEGCDGAKRVIGRNPGARRALPAIDPSLTVAEQLNRARAAAERGETRLAAETAYRLVQEENEDASWLLGGWMYYGLPGVFDQPRKTDGLTLFENAAKVGHIDAAVFMGMAYWYGDGVEEDRPKGEKFMLIAANRGSEMAGAIYRSMRAEPIRQENARRAAEMAAWAAKRNAEWQSSWSRWTPSWSLPSSTYSPMSTGPSVSSIIDNSKFNQMINYYSGGTSVCPPSNHYC